MPTDKKIRLAVTAAENAGPMAPILLRGDIASVVEALGDSEVTL